MARLFAAAALVALAAGLAAGKPDGTCGFECTQDSECSSCGTAGVCSCPDGKNATFFQISCSCVSAPANPPSDPEADVESSVWPQQWTATVDAWAYGNFSHQTATGSGKFYYDATLGRTRADWSPYITGKDAKQVWIADAACADSRYYVKTGPICLSFAITDPGHDKSMVGVERPDWMRRCKAAGLAKYVGREQVRVESEDVWVDHWSCSLNYAAANQSITFQNWHSLGLGRVPKGLPVRVTGGNSAPNPTRGSPRLSTVWYRNFTTGPNATSASDFVKPNWGICIPVGREEAEDFFGHQIEPRHVFSPAFHRRAHHLAHATPSSSDLRRARRPKPSNAFLGRSFAEAMRRLNGALRRDGALRTRACDNFTVAELHDVQRALFDARTPELDRVYRGSADTRRMAHASTESLEAEQRRHAGLQAAQPALAAKARDGACHEIVMWYVHHLSAQAREDIRERLTLPLLPEAQHAPPPAEAEAAAHDLHQRYNEQVSCAVCHVAPSQEQQTLLTV